jgi:hypothetical protein
MPAWRVFFSRWRIHIRFQGEDWSWRRKRCIRQSIVNLDQDRSNRHGCPATEGKTASPGILRRYPECPKCSASRTREMKDRFIQQHSAR